MTEHGWPADDWPGIYQKVLAADILVLAGPIWLGDNSSGRTTTSPTATPPS
jgi:multimeric flavodoxin WrbA